METTLHYLAQEEDYYQRYLDTSQTVLAGERPFDDLVELRAERQSVVDSRAQAVEGAFRSHDTELFTTLTDDGLDVLEDSPKKPGTERW